MASKRQKVLILEDESLIALDLEDELTDLGFIVVANTRNVADALDALDRVETDIAILDVNLGDEMSYPVARELTTRGIPLIFVTGYGTQGVDPEWADHPIVQKPYNIQTIADLIDQHVATSDHSAANSDLAGRSKPDASRN